MIEAGARTSPENSQRHLVQFYDAEPDVLVRQVAAFIEEGFQRGNSVVVIATPEHIDAFLSALGAGRPLSDLRSRRLVFLDAQGTLDQIMCDGRPDWRRFESVVGGTIRGLTRAKPSAGLRAYGEMVGILWAAGEIAAAAQLEKFWNVLLGGDDFSLFCAYPVDVFADDFRADHLNEVICAHTHVLPGGATSAMEIALDRAIHEVLGATTAQIRADVEGARDPSWGAVPSVEATILWLRNHQPTYASEILSLARSYYRACA